MINLIKQYWSCWLAALAGFWLAMLVSNSKVESLKADFAAERQALTIKANKALQQNIAINEQLSIELINKQNELTSIKQQLERSIADAIKNDGDSYNGMGADSLQLYKAAFGYRAKDNTRTTNDQATDKAPTAEVGQR